MWFIILIFGGLLIYVFFKVGISSFLLKDLYDIPGPRPLPFIGNMLDLLKYGGHSNDEKCISQYGTIYSFYAGRCPIIMATDPTLVEEILVKKSSYFTDRSKVHGVGNLMQKSLLRLRGKEWERVRSHVSPTFTPVKLRNFLPMIVETMSKLNSLNQSDELNLESVDTKRLFSEITIAIIAKTILGINIDGNSTLRDQFLHHAQRLLIIPIKNVWFLILNIFPESSAAVDWLCPYGIVAKGSIQFFESQIKKRMLEIRESDNDFLSMMINLNRNKEKEVLTIDEIMAQSILLLLAGFETSASTMTFLTYLLSMDLDQQEEVYDDIMANIKDVKNLEYADIQTCKLLESAVCETLRLYPPIDRIFRRSNANVSLNTSNGKTITVRSGTTFGIPLHILHRDSNSWPDPFNFNIHRFNPNGLTGKSACEFMPFGLGPRNCVGKRLGMLEVKAIIITLLSKYHIRTAEDSPKTLKFLSNGLNLLNSVDKPIKIAFIPREYS